ncbi:MAG TPA: hypothetical protein VG164_10185 [Trebonia sp.]|nr:hypothetical protein [Trebonia sp.]
MLPAIDGMTVCIAAPTKNDPSPARMIMEISTVRTMSAVSGR